MIEVVIVDLVFYYLKLVGNVERKFFLFCGIRVYIEDNLWFKYYWFLVHFFWKVSEFIVTFCFVG